MALKLGVTPAYGRDYVSRKDIIADLTRDRDFQISDIGPYMGKYVNLPQLREHGYTHLSVRYARLKMQVVIDLAKL